jgi:Z1 domain
MITLKLDGTFYPKFTSDPEKYRPEVKACIERSVAKLRQNDTTEACPGMLLGKIQSGKTRTFLGVMALAFDNDFDVCVVLTKGTRALAKQTFERIDQEFQAFSDEMSIFDIMNMPELSRWEMGRKLVFVVKKQADNLDRLYDAFAHEYPELREKRVLIIDDEADFASVSFSRSAGDISLRVIGGQIQHVRKLLKTCAFLQVTATPYALYLQPENITIRGASFLPIRPAFTELVPVHQDYVGGDLYFPENTTDAKGPADFIHVSVTERELSFLKKRDRRRLDPVEAFTSPNIATFRRALVTFVTGATIRQLQASVAGRPLSRFSFLVHTQAGKIAHAWQEELTEALVKQMGVAAQQGSLHLQEQIAQAYQDLALSVTHGGHYLPPHDEVFSGVLRALAEGQIHVTKVNSDEEVIAMLDRTGQLKLRAPMTVFIGGQILDRGITVANMIGFFYGRLAKRLQQDTVLQHSRMYGFRSREDVAVTRFYTAPMIYEAMRRMQECDNALRRALETSGDHSVIFIQQADNGTVIPCSPNKILLSNVTTIRPHKRFLPVGFQIGYKTYVAPIIAEIDRLIAAFQSPAGAEEPFLMPAETACEILERIYSTLEFSEDEEYGNTCDELIGSLRHLSQNASDETERGKVWVIWRGERDVARVREGGRLTNAPDSGGSEGKVAREVAQNIPALLLLKQTGKEQLGWRGTPFYWPVLLAAATTKTAIFATATRASEETESESEEADTDALTMAQT